MSPPDFASPVPGSADLTAHHVGCAVRDMDAAIATYADALGLGRRTRAIAVESQAVSVCFIELQPGFYVELVAALSDQAKLGSFLKVGFYHLCFLTPDLASKRRALEDKGFYPLPAFASEAFDGNLCQFFMSPQGQMIELAEMAPEAFDAFFRANLG